MAWMPATMPGMACGSLPLVPPAKQICLLGTKEDAMDIKYIFLSNSLPFEESGYSA